MIYQKLVKHVLFPLYLRRNGDRTLERLARIEKSQYDDPRQAQARQVEALQRLLAHCYRHVPFYRERFDAVGFDPASFRELSDLRTIPCLTKEELQQNLPRLVADNFDPRDLLEDASGGSTGKPTRFYKDRRRQMEGRADQFRHDRWCGWDLGEKRVTLWGAQREFEAQPPLRTRLVEKYLHRIRGFNAFDITEEKVLEYLDELQRIRPAMIIAYANVAYLFATVMRKRGINLSSLKLKGVICSAETLTEEKRATIEETFCCKALNRYGSREVGLVASECLQQNGLHVDTDSVHLEILRDGRTAEPGESGEIVVTDLWNYGMPFVRYRMGDVGAWGTKPCGCGRTLPTIADLQGRVSDFLVDERGGLVHGEYFTHLFYGIAGVEQFQLVQESLERLRLRIVPGPGYESRLLEPVIGKIVQCLGTQAKVEVETCATSMVESSGKFRFTVSKVSGGFFAAPPR